ncbi:hypothetical protein [Thermacetogenium phaeum]|nr:hypothetical protein [Thermacetogenium phaeum]
MAEPVCEPPVVEAESLCGLFCKKDGTGMASPQLAAGGQMVFEQY